MRILPMYADRIVQSSDRRHLLHSFGVLAAMRRSSLVILSWCVGFVWAAVLIHNAVRATPPAQPTEAGLVPPSTTTTQQNLLAGTRGIGGSGEEVTSTQHEIATPSKFSYVGNTKTYKFHEMSCRYSDCKNCTAYFATRQEAIRAGYRPCGVCDP
jgi:hypothetical protein